ncbi:MAG TPA: hypothetical protein PK986_07300 [Spirochaetota bacterium]|nr:hypothetical protein [Spirochaetota bacterium]HQO40257.1 hypothetical protein [Spirochaetota bacterium]
MRKVFTAVSALIILAAGCATEMSLKDAYVFNPASHNESKYPVNAVVTGKYVSGSVKLKEDIVDIYIKDLEGANLFANVDKKSPTRADISIVVDFTDYKKNGKPGIEMSVIIKQIPENKLIYRNSFRQTGSDDSYSRADDFALLLKKVIGESIADLDRKFEQFREEGNLPNHNWDK